jgi:hypothetical protein
MQSLLALDERLSPVFADLVKLAAHIEIPFVCPLTDEETIAAQAYPGIYRIDISTAGAPGTVTDWIDAFRTEWEHDDFKKKFTPNLKEKRIARHATLPEWMPLYLGKSQRVGARVLEHINLPLDKTTFALKLKARPSMSKHKLRLHALHVPVKNYDLVLPALEATLRDRFNPLIGKQ